MKANTRKKELRAARAAKVAEARETWREEEFGLTVAEKRGRARLTWDVDRDPFIALMSLDRLRSVVLPQLEAELVVQLRLSGVAWEEIGWALGTSGEAVRKKHARADAQAEELAREVGA